MTVRKEKTSTDNKFFGGNAVRRELKILGLHSTPANTTHVPPETALLAVFAYKEFFCRTCRQKNKDTFLAGIIVPKMGANKSCVFGFNNV